MYQYSEKRFDIADTRSFQDRILMLTLQHAHQVMDTPGDPGDTNATRLASKATEFLNQPEQFRERLALSTSALLSDDEVDEQLQAGLTDDDISLLIPDVFDALAGVVSVGGE
jgi:hypothetical protein